MIGGCVDLESQTSSQSFYRKIMVTFFLKIFIVFYMRGAIVTRVIVEFYRHSETLTSAILRIAVIDNYSMLKCRISSLNSNDTFMIRLSAICIIQYSWKCYWYVYFFGHYNKHCIQFRVITIYNFLQYVLQIRYILYQTRYTLSLKFNNLSKNALHIFFVIQTI